MYHAVDTDCLNMDPLSLHSNIPWFHDQWIHRQVTEYFVIFLFHIVGLKWQNCLKVGTYKPKLKVKMQSLTDDDVRRGLPEISSTFASNRESTATNVWLVDQWHQITPSHFAWTLTALVSSTTELWTKKRGHPAERRHVELADYLT